MLGDRAEGGDRPGERVLGGVLADAVLAGVHQRGDLGEVGAAFGVGDGGDLRGPRAGRERDQAAEPVPDPGVDDAGHVAGAGQVPFGDRVGQDLRGVQAGQFGAAQGAPQPPGLVARLAAVSGRQGGQEQVAVALLAGGGSLGGPDRVQQGQVVGVGEGLAGGSGWPRAAGRRGPGRRRARPAPCPAGQARWPGRGRRLVRPESGRSGPVREPAAGRAPGRRAWGTAVNTYARLASVPRVSAT